MTKRIRPATPTTVDNVDAAIVLIRLARDHLEVADCPKSMQKLRALLRSVEGAKRHAEHRARRTPNLVPIRVKG